jgi:hypothetical protein
MRGIPSVQESWSQSPRPLRLLLRGVPLVQNRGQGCLPPPPPRLPLRSNSSWGTVARDGSARRFEHHNVPRRSWVAMHPLTGLHTAKSQGTKLRKVARERMLAPPAGLLHLPRWARGHCRYPEDRILPHTSSKSRQKSRRTLMHAHVSRGSGSHLLAYGSSRAAICLVAPGPAPRPRAALGPPCVT